MMVSRSQFLVTMMIILFLYLLSEKENVVRAFIPLQVVLARQRRVGYSFDPPLMQEPSLQFTCTSSVRAKLNNVEFETTSNIQNGVVSVIVAESQMVPNERGKFLTPAKDNGSLMVQAGDILCGYGGTCGEFVKEATGDKAVPFCLEASSLVSWCDQTVRPLQSIILEKGATMLEGHRILRYGPNNIGVRVSIDNDVMPARTFVPTPSEETISTFGWETIGQFVNDYAFSPSLFQTDDELSALWKYEETSNKQNHVMICWNLQNYATNDDDDDSAGDNNQQPTTMEGEMKAATTTTTTLFQSGVRCVAQRDFHLSDGEYLEIGCHYGIEFWRDLMASLKSKQ